MMTDGPKESRELILTPKGIQSLIPQRLRGLFGRGNTKHGADLAFETTPVTLDAAVSASSPVHPDIEEGARHVLEERLVDAVKIGNIAGIEIGIKDLAKAWIQAQKAAGSHFELTEEGKTVIPGRVREICARYLNEGLGRTFDIVAFQVAEGLDSSIKTKPQLVTELFKIAEGFGIPLSYAPKQESGEGQAGLPIVLITTSEQAVDYLETVIDRNLPKGIHGIIKQLAYDVALGLLERLPDYEKSVDKWIEIMGKRGWKVVDEPYTPIYVEGKPGLLPRRVNRAEVRQLIEQAVKDNLAAGARHISTMVGFCVKEGQRDPIALFGSPENIALYSEAGERLGLIVDGAVVAPEGNVNPDLYFDPSLFPEQIRKIVIENLPPGLINIQNQHLRYIQGGNSNLIEYSEETLEQYITLAAQYGVRVKPDELRKALSSQLNSENLQKGVEALIAAIKSALREAFYLGVEAASRDAEDFKRFVKRRGYEVDFSALDKYMAETATELSRLKAADFGQLK